MGMGAYFIFFRPAFLPEDLRFIGAAEKDLLVPYPALGVWLARVFSVLGGYMLSTGILTVFVALNSFRRGQVFAAIAVALAGSCSIGLMTAINFMINSDFRWVLFSFAALWWVALVIFSGKHWLSVRNLSHG